MQAVYSTHFQPISSFLVGEDHIQYAEEYQDGKLHVETQRPMYLLACENGLAPYISMGIPQTTRNAEVNCAVASDSITHTHRTKTQCATSRSPQICHSSAFHGLGQFTLTSCGQQNVNNRCIFYAFHRTCEFYHTRQ